MLANWPGGVTVCYQQVVALPLHSKIMKTDGG